MMRSSVPSLPDLIQEARALAAAEALASARGHAEVAAMMGESRRLTLARLLRSHPRMVSRDGRGQIHVSGEGIVGTLTAAEAVAAGVMP